MRIFIHVAVRFSAAMLLLRSSGVLALQASTNSLTEDGREASLSEHPAPPDIICLGNNSEARCVDPNSPAHCAPGSSKRAAITFTFDQQVEWKFTEKWYRTVKSAAQQNNADLVLLLPADEAPIEATLHNSPELVQDEQKLTQHITPSKKKKKKTTEPDRDEHEEAGPIARELVEDHKDTPGKKLSWFEWVFGKRRESKTTEEEKKPPEPTKVSSKKEPRKKKAPPKEQTKNETTYQHRIPIPASELAVIEKYFKIVRTPWIVPPGLSSGVPREGGCCGAREFMKLQALSLTEYDAVVNLDTDMSIIGSIRGLFDCAASGRFLTARGSMSGVNGGMFAVKPSKALLYDIVVDLTLSVATEENGWNFRGLAPQAAYGQSGLQGFLYYYFYQKGSEHVKAGQVDPCQWTGAIFCPRKQTCSQSPLRHKIQCHDGRDDM